MTIFKDLPVPLKVRQLFEPYFGEHKHYGTGTQRQPLQAAVPWTAGTDGAPVTQAFVCSSPVEAVAFVSLYHARYNLDSLYFCAIGNTLPKSFALPKAKITLLFENTPLGKLWDIKIACFIRHKRITISYHQNHFLFDVNQRNFKIAESHISLSAFEQASGIRTQIKTAKAKGYPTFLEQLQNTNP